MKMKKFGPGGGGGGVGVSGAALDPPMLIPIFHK